MSFLNQLIAIRYEDGAWPLWRIDQSLRYVLRSLLHERRPRTSADQTYYAEMQEYVSTLPRSSSEGIGIKAAGDMMWIRTGFERFLAQDVREFLGKADLNFVNLETPIVPERKVPRWVYDTLIYNAPEAYLAHYLAATKGQNLVSICNNHAADQGPDGVTSTQRVIQKHGATCLGGSVEKDALQLLTVKGKKIAFIGSTYHINQFKRSEEHWPGGVPVISFAETKAIDWARIESLIRRSQTEKADVIVFCPHWGYEYEYWPGEFQRKCAHRLIELGVDIILGTSPHVLQPVEVVSINGQDPACPVQLQRPGPRRRGLICYSLGNFATIMPTIPCKTAGVLSFSFGDEGVLGLSFTPTYTAGEVRCANKNDKYWNHAHAIMGNILHHPEAS